MIAGADSRARRRTRAAVVGGGLAAAALAAAFLVPRAEPGRRPAPPEQTVSVPAATPSERDELSRLSAAAGRPVTAEQVVAAAKLGGESVIALPREARPGEGRAAEIWIARPGEGYRRVADYIAYDSGCLADDAVCEQTQASGLGFFVVLQHAGGRAFVLAQAPEGRRVEVRAQTGTGLPLAGLAGVSAEIGAAGLPGVEVRVHLPDGRHYRLPLQPGAMISR